MARAVLRVCTAITLSAAIFLAARTETGWHLLTLLVTWGANGWLSAAGAVTLGVLALAVIATAYVIIDDYRSGENWWED